VTTATDIAKPAKKAPKAKRAAKTEKSAGPREGSKTAQVVAMLQRKDGATLAEIMNQMGWQKRSISADEIICSEFTPSASHPPQADKSFASWTGQITC
jgi:hypothetical protein